MRGFLKSLGVVSVCFALSKVFSSVVIVVLARYLGKEVFGQASVILLVAQVIFPVMLVGLHMSVMRYGAGKDNAAPYLATSFYISIAAAAVLAGAVWAGRAYLQHWFNLSQAQVLWGIGLAVLIAGYSLLTHFYQAGSMFKARGLMEIFMGLGLVPGLALGIWLTGTDYRTFMITYCVAYGLCVPAMLWQFRGSLHPRHLWAPHTWDMLKYGTFACFSGIGFILTFVVQPLQLTWYTDEATVGIFRLYSASSLGLATFATTIFYTVFFPRVSTSSNQPRIWRLLTEAWARAMVPLVGLYAAVFSVSVWLSGSDYPLTWGYVALFSLAATLVTVQTTYGQVIAAQGIMGMRWVLMIAVATGLTNVGLSMVMIPRWGITGAIVTVICTHLLSLVVMFSLRGPLYRLRDDVGEPAAV